MKPYRSLSLIVTAALCAFAFLLATPAAEAKVVGTLKCKGTVLKNNKPAGNGEDVSNGDIVQTNSKQTATVVLNRGGQVFIRTMTRVRIFDSEEGQPMEFIVVYGGIDLRGLEGRSPSEWPVGWAGDGGVNGGGDDSSGAGPLPYLAAFGFGNFSFPSIGGAAATSPAPTTPVTTPTFTPVTSALP